MKSKEEIENKISELSKEKDYLRECVLKNNGDIEKMKQNITENLTAIFWLRWVLNETPQGKPLTCGTACDWPKCTLDGCMEKAKTNKEWF